MTAGGASAGLVWLAWAEFSAFQLSDFKERLGTSELLLCLAEKIVFVLGMAAGMLAVHWRCLESLQALKRKRLGLWLELGLLWPAPRMPLAI